MQVIVFYYLKMFFFPINQSMDIGFPFTGSGVDLKTLVALTVLTIVLTWVLLKGAPFVKVGTAWFFLTLAPTSSFIPLNDLAVEHRLYLPMSLGLCLIAGHYISEVVQLRRMRILLVCFLAAGVLSTTRNQVWLSERNLWQDAMSKNPHSPRPYNNLGKIYYERGEKERSIEFFRKSISLFKRSDKLTSPHFNLANVYMDFDRLQEAKEGYQSAIRLDPEHFAAYVGLGSVYSRTGRYDKAIKAFNQANKVWKENHSGDYGLAKLNLGEVYGKLGRFEEAIKELKLALKSSPGMSKAHFNLGTAYLKQGDFENAERSFLACLETNSQFAEAQFNMAHLYQVKKAWRASTQWFEKFLQTKGPDARVYFGIAWNHQQMGEWDLARSFYEKSLATKPDYLYARMNLASVYVQQKQFDQALVHFERVLEQNPKQFRIHIQTGIIYWKTRSEKKRARSHFKQALEFAPGPQEKKQVSELIKALARG